MAWNNNFGNWGYSNEATTSKYNAGLFKINRLHESWLTARSRWRNGDADGLNWELELIWIELEADADKEQHEEMDKINTEIDEALKIKEVRRRNGKLFASLKKKWCYLFRIEKKQGLGKAYYDDKEEELD